MFAPGAARDDGGAAGGGGQLTIDGSNISTSGSCVLSPGVSSAELISGEGCAGERRRCRRCPLASRLGGKSILLHGAAGQRVALVAGLGQVIL